MPIVLHKYCTVAIYYFIARKYVCISGTDDAQMLDKNSATCTQDTWYFIPLKGQKGHLSCIKQAPINKPPFKQPLSKAKHLEKHKTTPRINTYVTTHTHTHTLQIVSKSYLVNMGYICNYT